MQAAALNADPEVAALLRRQRELERELRDVKEGLDVAEQARKIEAESRRKKSAVGEVEAEIEIDGELVELIGRWTAASRQAAEELFGQVRDKVNRFVICSDFLCVYFCYFYDGKGTSADTVVVWQDGRAESLEGDAEEARGVSKYLGPAG